MIVRSAGAISCSSGEEGVVEMISEAERKKKPWWTPLFDIISEPEPSIFSDSASSLSSMEAEAVAETRNDANPSPNLDPNPIAARRSGVGFTAEKAQILRKELRATETFHDIMYHSALASRLTFTDDSSSSPAV